MIEASNGLTIALAHSSNLPTRTGVSVRGRFPVRLPLVGFEVESSWRTRKHIKGDVLNLIDLQPALGVIVLAR